MEDYCTPDHYATSDLTDFDRRPTVPGAAVQPGLRLSAAANRASASRINAMLA
ncbi:hypothetical protein S1361_31330 [Streptomyces cyanogenus]|uniref:Uncharacterized protein n=1 Tax=Streptomyces cyanogenus TaxID=80860 RepID=A0ABX7U4A4_STRCY|nr:hypothetical protein S1361_31330 [Streptomyces cyanogenus]